MNRFPLLLIAIFMLVLAVAITFFGISVTATPIQQQQEYTVKTIPFLPIAFIGAIILGFIVWVWALIHMLTTQSIQGADKIIWALVIIFLNVLGAILYFILSPFAQVKSQTTSQSTK